MSYLPNLLAAKLRAAKVKSDTAQQVAQSMCAHDLDWADLEAAYSRGGDAVVRA